MKLTVQQVRKFAEPSNLIVTLKKGMTISRPASILSIPVYEEWDHQGFKMKDDFSMEPLHNPLEIPDDDPEDDIDPSDVDKKELFGWYSYGFAAEGFAVVSLAFLIPIILEQSVEAISYEIDNPSVPCRSASEDVKCAFQLGNSTIDTTAYSFFVNSVGVAAQALILIGMGSLADHGSARKSLMLSFGFLGAICTLCFMFAREASLFWVIALLSILSNICFGTSWVFYNAFLPVLTRHQPKVKKAYREDRSNITAVSDKIANRLSAHAMGYGYAGGILALLCTVAILENVSDTMSKLALAISFTGAWWLIFMIISVIYLKPRPGPPLPKGEHFFIYSYKRVYQTIRKASRFAEIMKYLAAWLLLSDSVNTIITVAVIFAKTVLGASVTTLISLCGLVPLSAIFGAYGFLLIKKWFALKTKTMIMIVVSLQILLPLYAILGLFAPFGLVHQWELWLVAVYHGMLLGAMQSFSRVFYAEMLPRGREAEFFSLYALTDKGASWIGPLVVATITSSTHQIRYSFFFLLASMIIALFIIYTVNPEKGRREAADLSKIDSD